MGGCAGAGRMPWVSEKAGAEGVMLAGAGALGGCAGAGCMPWVAVKACVAVAALGFDGGAVGLATGAVAGCICGFDAG